MLCEMYNDISRLVLKLSHCILRSLISYLPSLSIAQRTSCKSSGDRWISTDLSAKSNSSASIVPPPLLSKRSNTSLKAKEVRKLISVMDVRRSPVEKLGPSTFSLLPRIKSKFWTFSEGRGIKANPFWTLVLVQDFQFDQRQTDHFNQWSQWCHV